MAYQIQVAALGGPDKATLRAIRQPKGRIPNSAESGPFEARIPSTREGVDLRAGALLVREWKGKLERVTVLEKGFAWNGKSYASLSQIAKAMTGTAWNGHRFFGLRAGNVRPRCASAPRAGERGDRQAGCRVRRTYSKQTGRSSPLFTRQCGRFGCRERGLV